MNMFRTFAPYCAQAAQNASATTKDSDVDVGSLSQFDASRAQAAQSATPAPRASDEFRHQNIMRP